MAVGDEHTLTPTRSLRPKLPGEETSVSKGLDQFEANTDGTSLDGFGVLGLLLLVALVVLAYRLFKPNDKAPRVQLQAERSPKILTLVSAADTSKRQPAAFDADNSKHLPAKKVIEGKAWVTDGDTIVINNVQIRLFGIDAPELNYPYGKKAKWAMVKLCKGHKVCAEITDVDYFGRTVAHCTLPDGRDLSAELVRMGLAIDWPRFSGGKYSKIETADARKKLWLADARQKGRLHVWEKFEASQKNQS